MTANQPPETPPDTTHTNETCMGSAKLDEIYAERNAAVLGFATACAMLGGTVGTITDPNEPDWPVLVIDTEAGQLTWHFKADELPLTIPAYDGTWDGHNTEEKYERLGWLVNKHWAVRG